MGKMHKETSNIEGLKWRRSAEAPLQTTAFSFSSGEVLARMRFEEKLTVRFYAEIENRDFQA
jgi:hypothetical protein